MKKSILPFNWQEQLSGLEADSIGNDFILIDKPLILPTFNYPFKVDVTTGIICLKGTTSGRINMERIETKSPGFIIIMPDQILQYEYVSEDFSALFIIMSSRFTESLNIDERFPAFMSIQKQPYIELTNLELEAITDYYTMLKRTIAQKDNPYCLDILRYLTKAFFYAFGYDIHIRRQKGEEKKSKHQVLVEKFLNLVQHHYKEERSLKFYAGKLYLTPKHLSKVVKENSGITASEWIDNYVILEAKALLKTTDMTVQQISDRLNFPSQSFFGKYFKRLEGVSPSEYKKN
ncbi:helix-turn-helix domain-containing protein [Parafilimonas sp.]|uniref:helix-turn-helix domain-containing protein n=1 Tax=Parafilimonas sp. TaxID=1969739 RepID=UPI0039E43055